MDTPTPEDTQPKKVAYVCCEKQTFKINIGSGDQTIKWLALATASKITSSRKAKGKVLQRSPASDGRLNTIPVPQLVTVGRQRKWVHPSTKIIEVQNRFGGTCILNVELAYRPRLEQGVHVRTIWSDVAFGGETGEERFQSWVAEQKKLGIIIGSLEDDDEEEENTEESKESTKDAEQELLLLEFENMWRGVVLEKWGSETEKKRASEYVFKGFQNLRDCFQSLTSQSNVEGGIMTLPELIHFCWQHNLEQCCTGLRKTFGNDSNGEKAMQAKLDEENNLRELACLVCFGEEAVKSNEAGDPKEGKTSNPSGTDKKIGITLPQFIEILCWYAAKKRYKQTSGNKNKASSYANAIALRQMLQRLEAPINRRKNETTRKLMTTKSIARVINDTSEAVRDVFENYCTADVDKNRKDQRWQSVMSLREFQLLMTDALLIGNRPGDDGPQATGDSKTAFFGSQANDEGSAVAFLSMNVEERAASSNVLEELVFTEFLEAIVRVSLAKWDDPEIPALDKIQLANEAIAVLHQ